MDGNLFFKKIKKNKCLIKINNKTLIKKIIDDSKNYFKKINVITGFKSHLIKDHLKNSKNVKLIYNKDYNKTEMLHSIITGLKRVNEDVVISYSDILVSKKIWKLFNKINKKEMFLPIKSNWRKIWNIRNKEIHDDAESLKINKNNYLTEIGKKIKNPNKIDCQFMGLIYIPKSVIFKIISIYEGNKLRSFQTTQFLKFLLSKKVLIKCKSTNLFWYEIDDFEDFKNLNVINNKID